MYLRGRECCMCSLELSHPGIIGKLAQDPVNAVAVLQQKDVPLMYWIRASWDKAVAAPDLYQLLAYATAAGLPNGLLGVCGVGRRPRNA